MRSAQLAGVVLGSLIVLASCGRDSAPVDTAVAGTAGMASVERGCYSVAEIGPVFEAMPWLTSLGVDSQGVVVGTTPRWSADPDPRRAFVFRHGTVSPLGDLGGGTSEARAANEWGYAVGGSFDGTHWRAASFFHGVVTDLGSLDGTDSSSWSVNDFGYAVGNGYVSGVSHAAGFFLGRAFDLGSLGGDTYANGVNDLFEVVGTGQLADQTWSGFVLRKGKMVQLGTLGVPAPSDARSINNRGTVCGSRSGSADYFSQAFLLFREGSVVELPGLGYPYTYCLGLSDAGVAVGLADDGMTGWRAVAWPDPYQPPVDLNSRVVPPLPDVQLMAASGISSSGLITAFGWSVTANQLEGYLLRPRACPR